MRLRALLAALVAGGLVAAWFALRSALRTTIPETLRVVREADDQTSVDANGAVRSIQSAEVLLPTEVIDGLWAPLYLERLARTYWRFLTRSTLGIVRVYYTEGERYVCAFARPFPLLTFQAPEYEMDDTRGVVRWRIERGLLVARPGREGDGYLEIDVQRRPSEEPGQVYVSVEIEIANFYPAIASSISQWLYSHTQSRIHVLVTHGFLRSLTRLDLEESVVGRFREQQDVPDPTAPRPLERRQAVTQ